MELSLGIDMQCELSKGYDEIGAEGGKAMGRAICECKSLTLLELGINTNTKQRIV